MNELYSHECPACSGKHPRNAVETGINFSSEVLTQALRAIYDGMNVEDEIQRDAFEEMLRIFNEAAVAGIIASKKTPPRMETFLEQLKYNNEVFSAFKVHRMQNDMAARLVDENGQLKPFEKWKRDVEDIADHYCNRWLQTEYDTAVLRAHQATDWLQFEAEKDVYPNLRWMPTTSPNPDEYHKQYWRAKLTLPINHPFWKSHRPGDRWNCKCSLRQTDEPATTEAIADFKPVPSQPGLDNNPAQDGKLFSDSHPYYTNAYPGAKEAAEKVIMKVRRKQIQKEADLLRKQSFRNKSLDRDIHITGRGIKEWLNQPHEFYSAKNELLLSMDKLLKKAKYLGYGPDRHDASIKAHLFETTIKGKKSWIIVREFSPDRLEVHSISDSEKIKDIITKKPDS